MAEAKQIADAARAATEAAAQLEAEIAEQAKKAKVTLVLDSGLDPAKLKVKYSGVRVLGAPKENVLNKEQDTTTQIGVGLHLHITRERHPNILLD